MTKNCLIYITFIGIAETIARVSGYSFKGSGAAVEIVFKMAGGEWLAIAE